MRVAASVLVVATLTSCSASSSSVRQGFPPPADAGSIRDAGADAPEASKALVEDPAELSQAYCRSLYDTCIEDIADECASLCARSWQPGKCAASCAGNQQGACAFVLSSCLDAGAR